MRAKVVGRVFCASKVSASRVAKYLKESPGFNKNIKKLSLLVIKVKGLNRVFLLLVLILVYYILLI